MPGPQDFTESVFADRVRLDRELAALDEEVASALALVRQEAGIEATEWHGDPTDAPAELREALADLRREVAEHARLETALAQADAEIAALEKAASARRIQLLVGGVVVAIVLVIVLVVAVGG